MPNDYKLSDLACNLHATALVGLSVNLRDIRFAVAQQHLSGEQAVLPADLGCE
jgi:hypothetical protein